MSFQSRSISGVRSRAGIFGAHPCMTGIRSMRFSSWQSNASTSLRRRIIGSFPSLGMRTRTDSRAIFKATAVPKPTARVGLGFERQGDGSLAEPATEEAPAAEESSYLAANSSADPRVANSSGRARAGQNRSEQAPAGSRPRSARAEHKPVPAAQRLVPEPRTPLRTAGNTDN